MSGGAGWGSSVHRHGVETGSGREERVGGGGRERAQRGEATSVERPGCGSLAL